MQFCGYFVCFCTVCTDEVMFMRSCSSATYMHTRIRAGTQATHDLHVSSKALLFIGCIRCADLFTAAALAMDSRGISSSVRVVQVYIAVYIYTCRCTRTNALSPA